MNDPLSILRVTVPTSLGRQYIIPALPRLAVQYPRLKVRVIFNDSRTNIMATAIDAALCIGPVEEASLVARHVYETRFVTCASPDYLARRGMPRTPAELDGHDCLALLSTSSGTPIEWAFQKNDKAIKFAPQGPLAISDSDALVDAAVSGAGIITMLDVLVRRSIASGTLRPILTDWQDANRHPISVVYRQQRLIPPSVRIFAEFVPGLFPRLTPRDTNCETGAELAAAGRSNGARQRALKSA